MYSHIFLLVLSAGLFPSSIHARFCSPRIPTAAGQPAIDPTYETIPGLPLCDVGEMPTPDGSVPVVSQPQSNPPPAEQPPPAQQPPAEQPPPAQQPAPAQPSQSQPAPAQSPPVGSGGGSGDVVPPPGGEGGVGGGGGGSSGGSSSSSFSTSYTAAVPQPSSSGSSQGGESPGTGQTYKATFTRYGSLYGGSDGNCQDAQATSCGWNSASGYTAAASQALYNSPASGVPGYACGSCWLITADKDGNGNPLQTTPIVVIINNECPAQGNTLCAQSSLTDTNKYGANVNIDLCSNSNAAQGFWGGPGGFGQGSITSVPCSQWQGVNGTKASWLSE